jgi:hypothetical protein
MKKIILSALVLSSCTLAGCASILGKDTFSIPVVTSPDGVPFSITDRKGVVVHKGETPQVLHLKSSSGYFKGEHYTFRFSPEGGDEVTYTMGGELSGWYIGNIILGGLIGFLIVDPSTGRMWKLEDRVFVSLDGKDNPWGIEKDEKKPSVSPRSKRRGRVSVMTLDQLPESLHQHLIPIEPDKTAS